MTMATKQKEEVGYTSDGQMFIKPPQKPRKDAHLRSEIIKRIGQLKDDRQIVRHRLEYDANRNEFAGLRKLNNILTASIIELEKHV